MPYYSVYISGGKDQLAAGKEAREALNERAADYTGGVNFFYVHKPYDRAKLARIVQDIIGSDYQVTVKRVAKAEYDGR